MQAQKGWRARFHRDLIPFLGSRSPGTPAAAGSSSQLCFSWSLSLTSGGQVRDLHNETAHKIKQLPDSRASAMGSCLLPRLVFIGSPAGLFPEMIVTLLAILLQDEQRYLFYPNATQQTKTGRKTRQDKVEGFHMINSFLRGL